jgi:hypothetical protein
MPIMNSQFSMELGVEYVFTLQSRNTKKIIIKGSRNGGNGDIFKLIVNGVAGEYSGLQEALGEPYIKVQNA